MEKMSLGLTPHELIIPSDYLKPIPLKEITEDDFPQESIARNENLLGLAMQDLYGRERPENILQRDIADLWEGKKIPKNTIDFLGNLPVELRTISGILSTNADAWEHIPPSIITKVYEFLVEIRTIPHVALVDDICASYGDLSKYNPEKQIIPPQIEQEYKYAVMNLLMNSPLTFRELEAVISKYGLYRGYRVSSGIAGKEIGISKERTEQLVVNGLGSVHATMSYKERMKSIRRLLVAEQESIAYTKLDKYIANNLAVDIDKPFAYEQLTMEALQALIFDLNIFHLSDAQLADLQVDQQPYLLDTLKNKEEIERLIQSNMVDFPTYESLLLKDFGWNKNSKTVEAAGQIAQFYRFACLEGSLLPYEKPITAYMNEDTIIPIARADDRTYRTLRARGIDSLGQLAQMTREQLSLMRNMGDKGVEVIKQVLDSMQIPNKL